MIRSLRIGAEGKNIFIAQFNAEGEKTNLYHLDAKRDLILHDFIIDRNDDFYLTGQFTDTTDFDGSEKELILIPPINRSAFLLKLRKDLNTDWAKMLGTSGYAIGLQAYVDESNGITWMGEFEGTIDLGAGNKIEKYESTTNTYNRNKDRFILQLNSAGEHLGGTVIRHIDKLTKQRLSLVGNNEFFVSGETNSTSEGNKLTYHQYLSRKRFEIARPKSDEIVACGSYHWPISGITYTKSGVYTHKSKKSQARLNLKIYAIDTTIYENGLKLRANEKEANYQWLRVDKGNEILEGETDRELWVRQTGTYAVRITSALCPESIISVAVAKEVNEIDEAVLKRYYTPARKILIDKIGREHLQLDPEKVKMIPRRESELFGFAEKGNPEKWLIPPRFENVFCGR